MRDLGAYLRQQRVAANLSVRQLSALTGISNPYLSQIERGLRRPSADILRQIAQGLSLSAESLYVRAGLLDLERAPYGTDTRTAIRRDSRLDGAQRRALLDAYARVVGTPPYAVVDTPAVDDAAASSGPVRPDLRQHDFEEPLMKDQARTSGQGSARLRAAAPSLTPLYAVVGASDLAVEKLREIGTRAAQDTTHGVAGLPHRAGDDLARVVHGARQVPQLALNQALGMVSKGLQQYDALARRGRAVDIPGQALGTAAVLVRQAGELVSQGRRQAGHVVDQGLNTAGHVVEEGRAQAGHVVEAVTHVARRPAGSSSGEVTRPTARRRRSPGATSAPAAKPTTSRRAAPGRAGSRTTAAGTAAEPPAKKAARSSTAPATKTAAASRSTGPAAARPTAQRSAPGRSSARAAAGKTPRAPRAVKHAATTPTSVSVTPPAASAAPTGMPPRAEGEKTATSE
ncbi:hypothetical protein KEM60_00034 [Austwickia sp. TVS 96-490-7B]|nr:hypothetical protein [Austwickia sp. TVS 96-490-7B]